MTTKTVYGYSDRQCIINIYISVWKNIFAHFHLLNRKIGRICYCAIDIKTENFIFTMI